MAHVSFIYWLALTTTHCYMESFICFLRVYVLNNEHICATLKAYSGLWTYRFTFLLENFHNTSSKLYDHFTMQLFSEHILGMGISEQIFRSRNALRVWAKLSIHYMFKVPKDYGTCFKGIKIISLFNRPLSISKYTSTWYGIVAYNIHFKPYRIFHNCLS